METIDPATGQPLPPDAIQRVLFVVNTVHVYNIPPLASLKGHTAATWTEDPRRHIFTCRLRVIETAIPAAHGSGGGSGGSSGDDDETVKADVVLEDPSTGQLFAAAPYTSAAVVEPAVDSARFFALRVQDGSGRRATLGVGFEDRSEAFDFGVALQEARKSIGLDAAAGPSGRTAAAAAAASAAPSGTAAAAAEAKKRDYSLKEGETITVNLGGSKLGRGRIRPQQQQQQQPSQKSPGEEPISLSSFALPPPPSAPGSRNSVLLAPPPRAQDVRNQQHHSPERREEEDIAQGQVERARKSEHRKSAQDLGFDDGQFGEFA